MKINNPFKRIFKRKPKPYVVNNFTIVPAFTLAGVDYYMHSDPVNTATGRGLTAMVHLEELFMRCDASYLKAHCDAMDNILSDPKKLNIQAVVKLNINMKERLNFLVAMPDHVYKMASIVFFTKDESPFKYDKVAAKRKIEAWKKSEGMYDFFLQTPLKTLMPFLTLPEKDSQKYLEIQDKVHQMHIKDLRSILRDTLKNV